MARGRLDSKFCFFIDGLDEYTGDHYSLIQDFARLVQSPQIKLCVSSRPWTIFKDHYGGDHGLKFTLEDLTSVDMHEYVRITLEEDKRFRQLMVREPEALSLAAQIRDRAEGVFLWVYLVVRSLLRGLNDHDSSTELKWRLSQIPPDLNTFFRKIVDTLDPAYQDRTMRAFQLATLAVPIPLLDFGHIPNEVVDKRFAIEAEIKPMHEADVDVFQKVAAANVNKWCRDLLEVKTVERRNQSHEQVFFLHRTVKDFLSTASMQDEFNKHSVCLSSPRQSLCRIYLAQTKALRCHIYAPWKYFAHCAASVMIWAKRCEIQEGVTPYETPEELGRTLEAFHARGLYPGGDPDAFRARGIRTTRKAIRPMSLLTHAVKHDLLLFVAETLDRNPDARRGLLGDALREHILEDTISPGSRVTLPMLTLLLEKGADPNERTSDCKGITVWQRFLQELSTSDASALRPYVEIMWRHGADPKLLKHRVHECLASGQSEHIDALQPWDVESQSDQSPQQSDENPRQSEESPQQNDESPRESDGNQVLVLVVWVAGIVAELASRPNCIPSRRIKRYRALAENEYIMSDMAHT